MFKKFTLAKDDNYLLELNVTGMFRLSEYRSNSWVILSQGDYKFMCEELDGINWQAGLNAIREQE
jgi:hypothetical protein